MLHDYIDCRVHTVLFGFFLMFQRISWVWIVFHSFLIFLDMALTCQTYTLQCAFAYISWQQFQKHPAMWVYEAICGREWKT